jgi:hypothetical protein
MNIRLTGRSTEAGRLYSNGDHTVGHATQLDWLGDHGVRRDHKGRIIAHLPRPDDDFLSSSDDSMTALQNVLGLDADEASIRDLMRRDVDLKVSGSRGRRRRQPPQEKSQSRRTSSDTAISAPMGRPALGAEIRVRVQTSVARSTRDVLSERGVTLAQIFDECALQLARHSGGSTVDAI